MNVARLTSLLFLSCFLVCLAFGTLPVQAGPASSPWNGIGPDADPINPNLAMLLDDGVAYAPAEAFAADTVSVTLEEALQIAMVNNYIVRRGLLDIDIADQQIREAWGTVYPQINATGTYTRNLKTPNPFAGSDAGGFFETFGAIQWLSYNEIQRTDADPATEPIAFDEFLDRQQQGYEEAGISFSGGDGGNPFAVENQFQGGFSASQAIYNGAAFAAIRGAREFRAIRENQDALNRQTVADQIRQAFYGALLAREQADVIGLSVERLRKTVQETEKAVEAGLLSKFERVSAQVELVNLETQLIEAQSRADLARKNLALLLGVPKKTELRLLGELAFDERELAEIADQETAYEVALQRRPDLALSKGSLSILAIEEEIQQATYLPVVNAFANYIHVGQVPSERQVISQVEGESFSYQSRSLDFFDGSYWDRASSIGVQLNWRIFDGFGREARLQQNRISQKQAAIDLEFQEHAVWLEIDQAVSDLETALKRIRSQERNLEQAQMNYEFAMKRLQEGAGTPLQERQASSLLDQSRLNYSVAVFDLKTALSRYAKATGEPILAD
jgi:outer membrane protein TolC